MAVAMDAATANTLSQCQSQLISPISSNLLVWAPLSFHIYSWRTLLFRPASVAGLWTGQCLYLLKALCWSSSLRSSLVLGVGLAGCCVRELGFVVLCVHCRKWLGLRDSACEVCVPCLLPCFMSSARDFVV